MEFHIFYNKLGPLLSNQTSMPRPFLRYFAVYFVLVATTFATSRAASIVVNEYKNSNGSALGGAKMITDEYIEFVLTADMTVAQLAALTFGDSNDTTSTLQGVFQFDSATLTSALAPSGLSAFKAGTIIVVKGNALGSQNLSYDPLGNPTSEDAWNLELVAGLGAKDHPETTINGDINIAIGGDVVWIASGLPTSSTDTSKFISAIGHDTNPGAIANAVISNFGAGNILSSTVGAPKAVYNTAGDIVSLTSSTTGSMGTMNGGANSTWINSIRSTSLAPEPSRTLLLFAGAQALLLRRRRPCLS